MRSPLHVIDPLGQVLLAHRLVSRHQIEHGLEIQKHTGERLGDILVRCGHLSEDKLVRALASAKGVRAWNLATDPPSQDAIGRIPMELCRQYSMLPVQVRGDQLLLATTDPDNPQALEAARQASGLRVEPVLVHDRRLASALEALSGLPSGDLELTQSLDNLIEKAMDEVRTGVHTEEQAIDAAVDTRPVVGLVNQMLGDAVRMRASDIHVEPRGKSVSLRYRLDGQLVPIGEFPSDLLPMVVARIKIMANLDIVEFRVPQDGRMGLRVDGRNLDMRVSVLPNYHGPRVVLRLLDRTAALRGLDDLGFSAGNLALFRRLIRKPHGMLLVTGPTGSGKTTTLYAALNEVQNPAINIMTAEDPIEYDLPGINQSQVNEKVGLTFAAQLRSILRQDPDVVLVGEIRDEETAEIALRAAMTGHLVLSTLHTNSAVGAVPRMLDLGVKAELLASSLIGAVAQRLVRVLCPHCKRQDRPDARERSVLEPLMGREHMYLYRPVGCSSCAGTGYRGRMAIHEMLPITHEMSRLIGQGATTEDLIDAGLKAGFRPIQLDAIERVRRGDTAFEEVERVVFFDDPMSGEILPAA